jgi:hypothetical protein
MEWHGNVFFPDDHEHFPSLVLHFRMWFDTSYPSTSPNIRLKRYIDIYIYIYIYICVCSVYTCTHLWVGGCLQCTRSHVYYAF